MHHHANVEGNIGKILWLDADGEGALTQYGM
jgi:hypothetical protein